MKVGESKFIGFNPARERAVEEFEKARVSIVYNRDLRDLWPIMFDGEILK
jgi:hypothetical protein